MRSSKLFYLGVAGFVLLVASSVFADGREVSYTDRVLAFRDTTSSANLVGSLICEMKGQNNGSPCEIKIRESGSGIVFHLENSGQALRLFNDGVSDVALTGTRSGDATFTIKTAKAR